MLDEDVWEVQYPDTALVLIGCSDSKLDRPAPARDLYTGALFRASVRWAESWAFDWAIVSALYGLVEKDELLEPYNARLTGKEWERIRLANMTWPKLHCRGLPSSLIVLAGEEYVAALAHPNFYRGEPPIWTPLQELPRRGLGYYRSWLARNTNTEVPNA
jgi:hypothetical protein